MREMSPPFIDNGEPNRVVVQVTHVWGQKNLSNEVHVLVVTGKPLVMLQASSPMYGHLVFSFKCHKEL